jgi:Transposase
VVVDQIRRRVQQATLGHRGRKRDPLYRIRKLLLTAQERLTRRGWVRLRAGLAAGDPTGEVAAAWQGKELLRAVCAAVAMPAARTALERFYRWADGVGVAELSRLARTVRVWEAEILAWHATDGCSNGPTEAVNLLVKRVKRVGHGFRNFTNYTAASHGRLTQPHGCEAAPHAWWRRALFRRPIALDSHHPNPLHDCTAAAAAWPIRSGRTGGCPRRAWVSPLQTCLRPAGIRDAASCLGWPAAHVF